METIAVYWEPQVRTYGFQVQESLRVWQLDVRMDRLGDWGGRLARVEDAELSYRWLLAQPGEAGRTTLWLICEDTRAERVARFIEAQSRADGDFGAELHAPVDVVFFQGPHYGDRYGIADFTFKALQAHRIPLLAMVCCVNSVNLVLPAQWGAKAKVLLSEEFIIPTEKPAWPFA
jgi:hypothetical protein